jgi:hypothetical protein
MATLPVQLLNQLYFMNSSSSMSSSGSNRLQANGPAGLRMAWQQRKRQAMAACTMTGMQQGIKEWLLVLLPVTRLRAIQVLPGHWIWMQWLKTSGQQKSFPEQLQQKSVGGQSMTKQQRPRRH